MDIDCDLLVRCDVGSAKDIQEYVWTRWGNALPFEIDKVIERNGDDAVQLITIGIEGTNLVTLLTDLHRMNCVKGIVSLYVGPQR